jgi:hypothetical protein
MFGWSYTIEDDCSWNKDSAPLPASIVASDAPSESLTHALALLLLAVVML